MIEVLGKCPICGSDFTVSELFCTSCKARLHGEFSLCDFCKLSNEQKYFVRMFLKNRGSIRDMEKELGISYPTVRNKLEEINYALGLSSPQQPQTDVAKILDKIKNGEMSAEDAVSILRGEATSDQP